MKKRSIIAILVAGILSIFAFKVIRNRQKKKKASR